MSISYEAAISDVYAEAEALYPLVPALGGTVAQSYLIDEYVQRQTGDSSKECKHEDPREYADTVADGHIPPNYFSDLLLRNLINEHYDTMFLPESLYSNLGLPVETSHFGDVIECLYARDETGGYVVPANLFLQSLAKINIAHNQEQILFANQWVPGFLKAARERLKAAVDDKQLPDYLLRRFDERAGRVRFSFDDGFHSLPKGLSGEFFADNDSVTMNFYTTYDDLGETGLHELLHSCEPEENEGVGLYRSLRDYPHIAQLLSEAVTEHASLVASRGGSVRKINPERAKRKSDAYETGREVLEALCQFGEDRLNIREFIDAQYASSGDEVLTSVPLNERFAHAFPDHHVLGDLEKILQGEDPINLTPKAATQVKQYIENLRKHYSPVRRLGQSLLMLAASFVPAGLARSKTVIRPTVQPASDTVVS